MILLLLLILLVTQNKTKQIDYNIPNDSIRLRIIASSNNQIDINTKLSLKEYLESELSELIKNETDSNKIEKIIVNNLELINNKINEYIGNNNYKVDYGLNYFPKKIYKGIIYEDGYYKSLVVTLGDGLGKNWWCTLFPPLCLLDINETTTDVEYKLFISSILNKEK